MRDCKYSNRRVPTGVLFQLFGCQWAPRTIAVEHTRKSVEIKLSEIRFVDNTEDLYQIADAIPNRHTHRGPYLADRYQFRPICSSRCPAVTARTRALS